MCVFFVQAYYPKNISSSPKNHTSLRRSANGRESSLQLCFLSEILQTHKEESVEGSDKAVALNGVYFIFTEGFLLQTDSFTHTHIHRAIYSVCITCFSFHYLNWVTLPTYRMGNNNELRRAKVGSGCIDSLFLSRIPATFPAEKRHKRYNDTLKKAHLQ